MKYLKLRIRVNREHLESAKTVLEAGGFDEMIIDDPSDFAEIEEHPEWYKYDYINEELSADMVRQPEITLFFSDDAKGRESLTKAANMMEQYRREEHDAGLEIESSVTSEDSEWLYKWQEYFKPTKVGEHFVVKPSWEDYEAKPGEHIIEMDPGMAFGSGLHETTTLCIRALEKVMSGARHTAPKVLDVGTGTGILSIAAAMLGAGECVAVDIDADAVRIAEENIARNGLSDKIRVMEGDLLDVSDSQSAVSGDSGSHRAESGTIDPFEADIIVANLMAELVMDLAPGAASFLRAGGIFISSGILDTKVDAVSQAIREAGFEISEVMRDGEWCAIVAEKDD